MFESKYFTLFKKRLLTVFMALVLLVGMVPISALAIEGDTEPDMSELNALALETLDEQGLKVVQVSLGDDHSAAITEDGSLWMWGYNYYGQLGDGTTTCYSSTPIKVMDDVVQVSLGQYHSAAIKEDGSLWMWGWNEYGQLGNGTTTDSSTPVKIMDNVVQVALGWYHSAAITEDGSLWMWGYNEYGQLGNRDVIIDIPIQIIIEDSLASGDDEGSSDEGGTGEDDEGGTGDEGSDNEGGSSSDDGSSSGSDGSGSGDDSGTTDNENTSSDTITDTADRLYGSNRFDTMLSIIEDTFDASTDTGKPVILANGYGYPDALAASGLAGATDGFVVLVDGNASGITQAAKDAIDLIQPETIYIAGGTNSISASIEAEAKTLASNVVRLDGNNRELTAIDMFTNTDRDSWSSDVCIIAYGYNYPDALAISPYAYAESAPIFLTNGNHTLSSETLNTIKEAGFTKVVIAGGQSSVSSQVEEQLASIGITDVDRLSGDNRFETSVKIADYSTNPVNYTDPSNALTYDTVAIASGDSYPDALAGGQWCAREGAVMLLVSDSSSGRYIFEDGILDAVSSARILGGPNTVSGSIYQSILDALS